uniref:Uncharacterized protein n=1 Tax=Rangifer tarandus platyrhynchus TaxID=3082113 RepID=A0ACB0EIP1_RANTA|nr:unnamed protein product [Rangifer tarandus platyrhynchus]
MLEKKGHKDHNGTTPDPPPELTCTQALGPHVASADLFPTKASPVPGLTGEPLTRSYSATRNGKCVPIGKAFCAARVPECQQGAGATLGLKPGLEDGGINPGSWQFLLQWVRDVRTPHKIPTPPERAAPVSTAGSHCQLLGAERAASGICTEAGGWRALDRPARDAHSPRDKAGPGVSPCGRPRAALVVEAGAERAQRECSCFAQSSVSLFHSLCPAAGSARGTRTGLSEGRFLHPTSAVGGGCPVPGASGGFGPPRELRGPQDCGAWAGISTFPDSEERGPNPFRVNGTACAPLARPDGRPAGTGAMRPAASRSPRPGCEWLFPDRPLPSALTHQPGFYSFPTRSAPWARGKKGKRTYLAALRGRPRGPAAGEGAPRSHSPPGRSPHGPSLPPRRRTPPSQLSRKREELPVRAPDTSSSARARISSLRADAQRNPEAQQSRRGAPRSRGGASRRYAAAPVARPDLGPGASF